jgi:hypothetical protein
VLRYATSSTHLSLCLGLGALLYAAFTNTLPRVSCGSQLSFIPMILTCPVFPFVVNLSPLVVSDYLLVPCLVQCPISALSARDSFRLCHHIMQGHFTPQLPEHLTFKCPYISFSPVHLLPTRDATYFTWPPLTGPGGYQNEWKVARRCIYTDAKCLHRK